MACIKITLYHQCYNPLQFVFQMFQHEHLMCNINMSANMHDFTKSVNANDEIIF
jgi:hypothetical protein